MLIDTHAHLTDERFAGDLADVLLRASAAGVAHTICIGTTAGDSALGRELARQYASMVSPSVGIHPNHAAEAQPGDWDAVVKLAHEPDVVGIGETGLDRHWDYTPFAMQEDYFARHLLLSRSTGKPVIIHAREAEADIVRMLRDEFDARGPMRGVLHSFAGAWPTAEAGLAMGLHISFAGMLTYKNAEEIRAAAARAPIDRLLVETDSPYLSPEPNRGRRNEPAHVALTAARLAQVRGQSLDEISAATTANAKQLFGIA